jgi:hypothetical protein
MSVWDAILKAKQNISAHIEDAMGLGSAKTVMAIRQGILDQVESKIVSSTDGKKFPFGKAIVRLQPQTEAQRNSFEKAFLNQGTLRADILQKLADSQARYPGEFEAIIEIRHGVDSARAQSSPRPLFEMDFIKHDSVRKQEIPETKLVVTKGTADRAEYRIKKERILIGSLSEVLDREGRMVRKNDVVFPNNGGEINSSVGYSHARIWFDFAKGEFCILDEVSRYGTRIVRDGLTIEVSSGDTNGIRLQSGDDIYFGQAGIRFELI